jgi:hypothetical protein
LRCETVLKFLPPAFSHEEVKKRSEQAGDATVTEE